MPDENLPALPSAGDTTDLLALMGDRVSPAAGDHAQRQTLRPRKAHGEIPRRRRRVSCRGIFSGKTAGCFAVVSRALTWKLDPFFVAQCTYETPGGTVGFMGKLCQAVLENSGQIVGGIKYEHFGNWEKLIGKFEIAKSAKGKRFARSAPLDKGRCAGTRRHRPRKGQERSRCARMDVLARPGVPAQFDALGDRPSHADLLHGRPPVRRSRVPRHLRRRPVRSRVRAWRCRDRRDAAAKRRAAGIRNRGTGRLYRGPGRAAPRAGDASKAEADEVYRARPRRAGDRIRDGRIHGAPRAAISSSRTRSRAARMRSKPRGERTARSSI